MESNLGSRANTPKVFFAANKDASIGNGGSCLHGLVEFIDGEDSVVGVIFEDRAFSCVIERVKFVIDPDRRAVGVPTFPKVF